MTGRLPTSGRPPSMAGRLLIPAAQLLFQDPNVFDNAECYLLWFIKVDIRYSYLSNVSEAAHAHSPPVIDRPSVGTAAKLFLVLQARFSFSTLSHLFSVILPRLVKRGEEMFGGEGGWSCSAKPRAGEARRWRSPEEFSIAKAHGNRSKNLRKFGEFLIILGPALSLNGDTIYGFIHKRQNRALISRH